MYIFTPPAASFDLPFTFEGLSEYIAKGKDSTARKLGTTLTFEFSWYDGKTIFVFLYATVIAQIGDDGRVHIPENIKYHGSQATTYWVQKVLTDNKLSGIVGRERGKYAVAGKTFKRELALV